MSAAGDNSEDKVLRGFVERVENLIGERKNVNDDIKGVLAEASLKGYDKKIIRKIIALRAMNPDDRHEMEERLEEYKIALGLDLV